MTSIYKGRVLLRARRRLTPALGLPDGRSQLLARARCTQMACLVDHAPGSLWLSVSRLSASLTVPASLPLSLSPISQRSAQLRPWMQMAPW